MQVVARQYCKLLNTILIITRQRLYQILLYVGSSIGVWIYPSDMEYFIETSKNIALLAW